jgi:hypothetical protein
VQHALAEWMIASVLFESRKSNQFIREVAFGSADFDALLLFLG